MRKTYKIEINPSEDQKTAIHKNIGTCRVVYNLYVNRLRECIDTGSDIPSGYTFSKYLNNEFLKNNPSYKWIKGSSSKAIKQSIMNCNQALNRFFKKFKSVKELKSYALGRPNNKLYDFKGFPSYKKKTSKVGVYLPKNNPSDFKILRHRVKVPVLGWVHLKEYGYLPMNARVKSCTVTKEANRYFVSFLVEEDTKPLPQVVYSEGIGVDLGIKDFAITSDGEIFSNINKGYKVKNVEKRLKRLKRSYSRKLDKTLVKIHILNRKLSNMRTEYVRSVANSLVRYNPKFVVIEDLNISGMMKNRHLSRSISQQNWYYFMGYLKQLCLKRGIDLIKADRFFPSSKTCSRCGNIKKDLKLKDRVFKCSCGFEIDRDLNAALNLKSLV